MTTVSIKLLIDSEENRVLFAEAGKDFVDFLFTFLSLPVSTLIRLLTAEGMVGCLGNLYQSVETIGDTYMVSSKNKDTLIKPTLPNHHIEVPLLLPNIDSSPPTPNMVYRCSGNGCGGCHDSVAVGPNARCPGCDRTMNVRMKIVNPPVNSASSTLSSNEGGFVKGVVTYMIMDDLVVRPLSTISSIALLNKFNVKKVGALQEKVIDLGMDEGVKLLRASLQSKTVLTDVFLAKKNKGKI